MGCVPIGHLKLRLLTFIINVNANDCQLRFGERAWYKTERFDQDGSADPQSFAGVSWANVVSAVNRGGLGGNHLGAVCTEASCGAFEETDPATLFDLSAQLRVSDALELYGVVENLSDELYIASRDPYGVRPNKPRTLMIGAKFGF